MAFESSIFSQKIIPSVIRNTVVCAVLAAFSMPVMAADVTVTVNGMAYAPALVQAHVGDTIHWVNKDPVDHTATARNKAFNTMLPAGKTVIQKVSKAGSFDFYCTFHPNMTGKLIVSTPSR